MSMMLNTVGIVLEELEMMLKGLVYLDFSILVI